MTHISDDHYKALLVFAAAARELEKSAGRYTEPAQSAAALQELHGAHQHVVRALQHLHHMHAAAHPGEEYEAGDREDARALKEASGELAAAAVAAQAVVDALHRAWQAYGDVQR